MAVTSALTAGQALGLGYTQAGLGLVSPFVQGAFGLIGQNQAYKQNKALMWRQGVYNNILNALQWEREMQASNTAYRRAVKDLKGAGLNPILAVNGMSGASTPNMGAPSVSGHSAASAGSISPLTFNILDALESASRIASNSAQAEKMNQEKLESIARTANTISQGKYDFDPEVIKLKKRVLDTQGSKSIYQSYGDLRNTLTDLVEPLYKDTSYLLRKGTPNSAMKVKTQAAPKKKGGSWSKNLTSFLEYPFAY